MQPLDSATLFQSVYQPLKNHFDEREASAIAHELLHHFFGLNRVDLAMKNSVNVSEELESKLAQAITDLQNHKPLQHILGETEFYGCHLKTDGRALIPRPETEELVDWMVKENELDAPKILDIGTGTGCIPIALKKAIPAATVTAIDVSELALSLAKENGQSNHQEIEWLLLNVLTTPLPAQNWDIIVSNPPYIPLQEKTSMDKNVADHEPGIALFVADDDPLIFYKKISELAIQHLAIGGALYFEIHENFGNEILRMLEKTGFSNVVLRKDLQGKDRMIQAQKYYR